MIRAAVVGSNVGKSRSPAIHTAAFRALGIEGSYEAFSVDGPGFRPLVRRLAAEGFDYLNITIPHKHAAAGLASRTSPLVRAMAAANTLIIKRGRAGVAIRAENTDGYGLMTALGDLGVIPTRGTTFVMIGSGGAAAGALAALVAAGAAVRLIARRPAVARALRARFSGRAREQISVDGWTPERLAEALNGATSLISAVPAAAWADDGAADGLQTLARTTAVLEMAYGDSTPLAGRVRGRVSRYQDGLPMLVHQAARTVELVTGRLPPAAPLLRAAKKSVDKVG